MNQEKIGKFIAESRKNNKMTQEDLAEKLGVSSKSISRWENGRNMPDVSLFEPLCKELNISINELLNGEKTKKEEIEKISEFNIIGYSKYLKEKSRKKVIFLTIITILVIILSILICILALNKTFFRNVYLSEYLENVNIKIPMFCYYRGTGGMYITRLKTLKQPDEVNVFIDRYLATLEKIEFNGRTYYYNSKDDFTITQYGINNDGIGFINTIYISYCDGKYTE